MSEDPKPQDSNEAIKHLNVLPHSGKVEELRQPDPVERPRVAADQTLIDRACVGGKTPEQRAIEEKVIRVLRRVFDPEIPVNIYELGLIYEIRVNADHSVYVKMTLTAPACPVADTLPPDVERRVAAIEGVTSAEVELVWDPPWDRSMMSEAAMLELNML